MGQMGSAPFASTRRRRRDGGAFSPLALYANGEAGGWWDPSDLTPEKVSWRRNLLTYSEQFDNSAWTKSNATITANAATAPDGSTTADKLVENTANNIHECWQNYAAPSAGYSYTWSVYAKAAERSVITLRHPIATSADFNLTNGTVSGAGATIENVGNGWYRCALTAVTTDTANRSAYVRLNNGSGTSYTGDGSSGVLIWGAQLEAAPTASSYQRITDFTSDFLAAFPTHALYQDSAGTTPVTALGQPVGLVLDKSKGGLASLGSNTVTGAWENGWTTAFDTFAGTTTGFTGSTTGAKSNIRVRVPASLVAGRTYAVEFTVTYTNVTLGTINFADTGYSGINVIQSPCTALSGVPYRCVFTASAGVASVMLLLSTSAATSVTLAGLAIREVPGAHAIQATSASRPTCDARVNLLTYSEQLDNAVWVKAAASVGANAAVAPDGTSTADALIEDATNARHATYQISSLLASLTTPFVASVYVKANTRTSALFGVGNSRFTRCIVNLSTGVAGALIGSEAANLTTTVSSVGNGWWRVVIAGTFSTADGGYLWVGTSDGTEIYTGNGTSGVLVWGADLRVASDASLPYQRVVTASDYADVQAPRYLTCDGIDDSLYTAASVDFATWTSGTRRNLLTYPSAFDNAVWSQGTGGSVSANTVVAPDGTTTADAYTWATSTPSFARLSQYFAGTPQVAHTFSIWLKRPAGSGSRTLALAITDYTISTASVLVTVTEEWQRFTFTRASPNATGFIGVGLSIAAGSTIAAGDVLHVWGAQLELGSTATAFQDVGTDKVSVFTGVRKLSDAAAGLVVDFSTDPGSFNGVFRMQAPSSAAANYRFVSKGTSSSDAVATTYAAPITNVVTGVGDISGDSVAIRVNSVLAATGTADQGAGNYGTYVLFIGRVNNATNPFNGRLYQLIVRGAQTDTATVQQTERFVAGKTGVTL